MSVLQHDTLGPIRGKHSEGIMQYLGVKYAWLADRFAAPVLWNGPKRDCHEISAVDLGPAVPSPPGGYAWELALIQHDLPDLVTVPPQSDLDGLNLNITMPSGYAGRPLPVLVFIHGGGFAIGSNSWPQFDMGQFVRLSIQKGTPVIVVTINYRLGVFGFLHSEELRKAGYKANNGLRDQIAALQWLKKHVKGFGGDPDEITVAGHSAGGVCATLLLYSTEALFKRLISIGGTFLLQQPLPSFLAEASYEAVIKALGLENLTPSDRMKGLLEIPSAEIVAKTPRTALLAPLLDNDLITSPPTFGAPFADLPGTAWCKDLMIGDCALDGSIFSLYFPYPAASVASNLTRTLYASFPAHSATITALLDGYSLSSITPSSSALLQVIKMATSISFHAPVRTLARAWPGSAHVYHFNEPNPWPGPWSGQASHILDVAFLFQNFNRWLTPPQVAVAEKFAEKCCTFVAGGRPWEAGEEFAMIYCSKGEADDGTGVGKKEREAFWSAAGLVGLDGLADAWARFMAGV